jgi:hypothetical protein
METTTTFDNLRLQTSGNFPMSIDLDVFAIFDENDNRFSREIVERAFAPFIRDAEDMKEGSFPLYLRSGEQTAAYMYLHGTELLESFSINRPPGYEGFPEFWDAVYDVMRQTRTFCFSPDGKPDCCVANPDIVDKVPAGVADESGRAHLVSSGEEIIRVLFG